MCHSRYDDMQRSIPKSLRRQAGQAIPAASPVGGREVEDIADLTEVKQAHFMGLVWQLDSYYQGPGHAEVVVHLFRPARADLAWAPSEASVTVRVIIHDLLIANDILVVPKNGVVLG